MIREYRAVRAVATAIAEEANATMEAYRNSKVVDEPHITDRLLGAIESRLRNLAPTVSEPPHLPEAGHMPVPVAHEGASPDRQIKGAGRSPLKWDAMTLRAGSGSAGHKKRFGADLLGVLSIDAPDFKVTKGFLAQAKRAEPGVRFSNSDWGRMSEQCEKMLEVTRDSFVLVYSLERGMRFFSAEAVRAFRGRDLFELYDVGFRTFFERHLECFIGDRRLNRPEIGVLEALHTGESADIRPSAHVLSITARET